MKMRWGNFLFGMVFALMCVQIGLAHESKLELLDKDEYHSQALQDKFVYMLLYGLLDKRDQGYYLEIGAGEPIFINNSYFFEKNLAWKGVSIDISTDLSKRWYAVRNNYLLTEDATKTNYSSLLQSFPKVIDYLSLDTDGHYSDILKKIPFQEHLFKIITIEHDYYRFGDLYRNEQREILGSLGYHLLCADITDCGCSFEDWWIHPSFFSPAQLAKVTSMDLKGKDFNDVIRALHAALQ